MRHLGLNVVVRGPWARAQSQLMADKITTVPKRTIWKRTGRLADQDGHHQRRGRRFSAPGRLALSLGRPSPAKVAGDET
jgi:hypothetical protein